MKKGISPIIGTVLLIAATMTIAGILAFWASSFVQQQTEYYSNETTSTFCNFANFRVLSCMYNKTSDELAVVVDNYKSHTLKGFKAIVWYSDVDIQTFETDEEITANSIKSIMFENITKDLTSTTKVIIRSSQCSSIEQQITCNIAS